MTKSRARIALIFLFLSVCFVPIVNAQSDYKVVEVVVEGNHVASRSLILGVSAIYLGSPLSPTSTTTTIRRLYALGIFSDIKIEGEIVSGGLKVFIIVKELPKLTGIEFKGNSRIDSDELKDKLGLGVGGYISPYLMNQKKNEIADLYANKGYFQAVVTSSLEYSDDSTSATLSYTVDEKSKVKVEKVFLTGNERVPSDDIIKKMRNRKRGFLKTSDFAKDEYEEDLEKIINEFHKKGHIDAYLISDSSTIDTTTNRMKIYLHVYEGPRYFFGNATFTHIEEMPEKYLKKKISYSENDVFDMEKYQSSIEEIYSAYYDIGHLHIRLIDERTTREDSLIDINYDITEGLPSRINLVKIVGNTKTKDKVIRRELSALPGQKFNRELLIRSVRDAMALNFFTNVNPVPVDLPNGDVDIEFQIEEKQTAQASAGAGYNSQDGIVGNLGIGIPNFRGMGQNLSFNTDFGSSRNSFSVSFTEPWFNGRPTLFGTDIYSTKREWFDDYTESRQGASIKLGKRLRWPDNYFRVFASYRLERDRYQDFEQNFIESQSYKDYHISQVLDSTGRVVLDTTTQFFDNGEFTGTQDVISPVTTRDVLTKGIYPGSILNYNEEWNIASRMSFTITRDSRNLPEFATAGSKFAYTFEKTGGILGGFWQYSKHKISYAKFFPIYKSIALAVRTQFGGIFKPSKFDNDDTHTLISDRFTPGGVAYDGIVRGYDDGSLTPDTTLKSTDQTKTIYYFSDSTIVRNGDIVFDPNVDSTYSSAVTDSIGADVYTRVRGNFMLISNIELQVPIVKNSIYGILFFDAGNSWEKFEDIQLFTRPKIYSSLGVGFRIAVPGIGTIGFDFAKPLSNIRNQDNGWRNHFQIGTTFK